jgi:hypothetical protein
MEHRYGTRYKIDVDLYARMYGGVVSSVGKLREVSVSGGFVRTVLQVRPLARVSLQLFIPVQRHRGFFVEGHVVRSTVDGFGVEWSEYASELVRVLTHEGQGGGSTTLPSAVVPHTSIRARTSGARNRRRKLGQKLRQLGSSVDKDLEP